MPNTFHPTNIGYIPTGAAGVAQISTFVMGRTNTGSYEGAGFGAGGRPDPLQLVQINLMTDDNPPFQKAAITINVNDLVAIAGGPSRYYMTLKEVTVCDAGQTRKAVVLMSQLYT